MPIVSAKSAVLPHFFRAYKGKTVCIIPTPREPKAISFRPSLRSKIGSTDAISDALALLASGTLIALKFWAAISNGSLAAPTSTIYGSNLCTWVGNYSVACPTPMPGYSG